MQVLQLHHAAPAQRAGRCKRQRLSISCATATADPEPDTAKQRTKADTADESKDTVLDMDDERKMPAVSPRRVAARSPHRQSGEGYTGSLFSYTPGIRSLRNIVDV